ncbi:MAG: hypothetical protein RI962_654, partial [Pseudomonadota bacterium]
NEQISVLGVDINKAVVDGVNTGSLHFVEPGLESLLRRVVSGRQLRASDKPEIASVYLICVPIPILPDHRPDLTYLDAALSSVAPLLRPGALLIIESSSPVGNTERLRDRLAQLRPDLRMPFGEVKRRILLLLIARSAPKQGDYLMRSSITIGLLAA